MAGQPPGGFCPGPGFWALQGPAKLLWVLWGSGSSSMLFWGQDGSECLEKMFILLLKMGVNRLGQPREVTSELSLDHNVAFSRHPIGRVSPAEDTACQRPAWRCGKVSAFQVGRRGLAGKAKAEGWEQTLRDLGHQRPGCLSKGGEI